MNDEPIVVMFDVNSSVLTPEEYFILESTIGYISNILIFFMMIPQIYKAYKYRLTDDISYKFIWISIVSSSLEIIYGVLINQIPVLITGIICFVQMVLLGVSKKLYDNPKEIKIQRKLSAISNDNNKKFQNIEIQEIQKIQSKEETQIQTWEISDNQFTYTFRGKHNLNKVDTRKICVENEKQLYEEIECIGIKYNT